MHFETFNLKYKTMRILLSLLIVATGLYANAQHSKKGMLYLNKSLSAESINQVEASTSGGGIEVTGVSNTGDAHIEVYITENGHDISYSKDELDKKISSDYELSVTTSGNKLTAIAKTKRNFKNWNSALNFSFVIYVPVNCGTHLNTSGGGIS